MMIPEERLRSISVAQFQKVLHFCQRFIGLEICCISKCLKKHTHTNTVHIYMRSTYIYEWTSRGRPKWCFII